MSLVMEAFPELLSESQRTKLTLGLQVRERGGGEEEGRRGGKGEREDSEAGGMGVDIES